MYMEEFVLLLRLLLKGFDMYLLW